MEEGEGEGGRSDRWRTDWEGEGEGGRSDRWRTDREGEGEGGKGRMKVREGSPG